jgi:hypothetical protein
MLELVLDAMELPESTRVISTVLEPDDPADYPPQDLASDLARMWQRALGVDLHARTRATIDHGAA